MKTVLSCYFKLETNRFAPGKTDETRFRERVFEIGDENVRTRFLDTSFEVPGFQEVFDPLPEYRFLNTFAFEAQPGGVVSSEMYERATFLMLERIAALKEEAADRSEDASKEPAALLLALHGAMVAEGHEDADGDLIERLRKAVGPDCPIFVTLDLHVNLTKKMVANADYISPCEEYPHTDYRENGRKAALILKKTLENAVKPCMAVRFLPMLFPYTPTKVGAFLPYHDRIQKINEEAGVLNFRFAHGFFASDVEEGGPAAIAVTDGNPELAERLADDFAADVDAHKKSFYKTYLTAEEAVRGAKKLLSEGVHAPIVLADVADNPGSGATADSVVLLKALADSGIEAMYSIIFDPEAVAQAEKAGEGAVLRLKLGGKTLPELTGDPLETEVTVLALSDGNYVQEGPYMHGALQKLGRSALLLVGNVKVIVSSIRLQPSDRACFHLFGLSPETCPVVAVKSAVHFRASYEPVAGAILEVETPALGPMDPRALHFRNVPKDFYPLHQE